MDDDNKKLKLEVEVAYDSSGEKLAVEGIKNVDKAVQDLGKSSDDASKKLAQVITSNMDPVTKKQVEGVLASMNKLDATMKKVNQDIEQMLNVPAGTTSGELSGLEGDAKKVTKNVKEATQETEKLASANKRAADQGERLANVQNKKAKKPAEKAATPDIDKTLNTAAVDKMVEKSAKATKNIEDMSAAASAVATVTNTLVDAADKLAAGLNAEIAALENVGSNASLTARELAILNSVHESFAQTASANAKAFAEEQAKINAGVSALSTAAIPAVEGLEDASSKLTDTFNKEAEALERVSTYADLSQKDIRALENIEKSFGRTASASVKEVVAEQEKHNKELEEAIRLATIQKNKQDLLARSQQITTGIATGGPLNIPDFEYIQRIKNVNVSPEEYAANLEKIKRNFDALTQEIEQYMTLQNTTLESAQADLVKAQATEDSKERLEALNSVLARHNRMALENSVALKQANLLSRDFVVGIIERTNATEADGDAEEDLKQEVVDAANAYLRMLDAIEATNNQAKLRKADIKDEIKGTKDLIAAKKVQERAEEELARRQREAWAANQKALNTFASMMNTISQLNRRFGQSFTRYVTAPLAGVAIKAAKFAADMEMNLKSIEILLYGNAEAANALYTQVVAYAASTPYEIPDLTEATKQLLSYGTAAQDVMGELRMLGDLAQNDAKKLDSITQAFGKAQARGVIHMRELNRFILSGIPIMQALADVMDTSVGNIIESVQKGGVSFKAVKAAMVSLTSEGGKFYNMSEELSQTIKGRWATMNDEINLALKSFVDDYMPTLMKAINWVIEFAQALQNMSLSEKQVILDTVILAAKIGPILLGISAVTAAASGLSKIIVGLGSAIGKVVQAGGLMALVGGMGAPAVASLVAAIAILGTISVIAASAINQVREAKQLLEESMEKERAREVFTPEANRSLSNLYTQKTKGVTYASSDIAALRERFTEVDDEMIKHILDTVEPLTAFSALDTLDATLRKNKEDMSAALKNIDPTGIYTDAVKESLGEDATDAEFISALKKMFEEKRIHTAVGGAKSLVDRTWAWRMTGKKQKDLDMWADIYTRAFESTEEAEKTKKEYATALDLIQQRYIGSVISPGAKSGTEVYGSFASHLATTSETSPERLRRLAAASTQLLPEGNALTLLRSTFRNNIAYTPEMIEPVLASAGLKKGEVLSDVMEYFLSKPDRDPAAFDEVMDFFKGTVQGIGLEITAYTKEQENKFKTDNILNYIFPSRGKTIEAGQKFAENMANTYESIASSIVQGFMSNDNMSFEQALEKFMADPNYEQLRRDLAEQLALSESKKIFQQITEQTKGATDALDAIDWNPVQKFQNNLLALLDSIEGIDKKGDDYAKFSNAIKRGAKNMAEAAYLTERKNLGDVIAKAVLSDEQYYYRTLTNMGIDSAKHGELWRLKGQGDFLTQEKDLNKQLDAAKAVTDEEKIRLLAVEGVTLEQAQTLFYLNKQVEAYEKLQESAKALKDFAKTNLDTPKYVKNELTKKGGILGDIFKARGVDYTGNIDLYDRLISSDDETGEKYSLKSITVQDDDGQWVNIPTVFGRNVLGESAAFERYRKSGQHLGKYDTSWEAERRAMDVSDVMGDILQFTEVPHDINYAIKPTTKGPRGVARIEERNALLTTLRDDTLQSKLDAVETFKTGGMTLDQLTTRLGELDDEAMDNFKLIDELFPVTDAMLFDDALKDIGDSLISLGLTGVVGMFEDFGKALASGSVGADSFMTSLDNMLSSLGTALPQLFLNAGLSLISAGKWKVGLALVGMSAVAAMFKGLAEGEDAPVTGTATGIKLTKSAKGNLFSRGELLNSPTLFKTPSGFNLAGEQGTEAIMPLGRTTDGKLGIYATGGGGDNQANVVVNVINQSDNSESEVVERTDANGMKTIDVIIKNVVNKQISEGGYDRSLGARYGVRNRGIA